MNLRSSLYKNVANLITFSRLILVCCLMYLLSLMKTNFIGHIFNDSFYFLFSIFVFVVLLFFAFDYLDGYLARKLDTSSSFGAYFDLFADFVYVALIHIQLAFYDLIPFWFLLIIFEKILNFFYTSKKISQKDSNLVKDSIGFLVVMSFYALPLLICLINILNVFSNEITLIIIVIISFFSILSSILRLNLIKKDYI